MRSKRLTARLAAEAAAGVAAGAATGTAAGAAARTAVQRPAPVSLPMSEAASVPAHSAHREAKKKGLSLPWLFAGVIFAAVAIAFVFRQAEVMTVRNTLAEMRSQIDYYRSLNNSLTEQVEALQSDEYIEKAAREKLGLVRPGEVQYMVIGYDAKTAKPTP